VNWQFTSTADIEVPPSLIDQVLGQPKAVEVITLVGLQEKARARVASRRTKELVFGMMIARAVRAAATARILLC